MIHKAISICGNIIPIDFNELLHAERLEGATIFKRVFHLDIETPFKLENVESLNKDANGNLTILQDFRISITEWVKFMNFIRMGSTPYSLLKNKYNKKIDYSEAFLIELERLSKEGVFAILGPIPSFEIYYRYIETKQHDTTKLYNPQTPLNDERNKYIWRTGISLDTNKLWSVTQPVDKDASYYQPIMYMRRLLESEDIEDKKNLENVSTEIEETMENT